MPGNHNHDVHLGRQSLRHTVKPNLLIALALPSLDDWFPTPVSAPDASGDNTDTDGVGESAGDDLFAGEDADDYICNLDAVNRDHPIHFNGLFESDRRRSDWD